MEFMNAIGYEKLFDIHDKCIVFANDKTELVDFICSNSMLLQIRDKLRMRGSKSKPS